MQHNLLITPAQSPQAVECGGDLARVQSARSRSRVVAIVGSLGAGTTSLALRTASIGTHDPDGAWVVDVAAAEIPGLLEQLVADAGGVRGSATRLVRHALVDSLRTRSVLVVLDGSEHALAECRDLATELLSRCPGVTVLSAGTRGLGIAGEILVPLPRREPREVVGRTLAQLGAAERCLLRRLSALGRAPSLRCAEATCTGDDLPPDRVMEAASALVARGLISWEGPPENIRMRMREEVRPHAAAMLVEAGEQDGAGARLARWSMNHASDAETEMPAARAALLWGTRTSPDVALRLAVAMRGVWERGRTSEGRVWLSAALSAPGSTPAARAPALALAGELAIEQGDHAAAEPWLEEAVDRGRRLGDRSTVARALRGLSASALARGADHSSAAIALAERAVAAAREAGPSLVAAAMMTHAAAIEASGDERAARGRLEDALAAFRAAGDTAGASSALNALGASAARNGYLETARSRFEDSLLLRREVGDREGEASTLANLAAVASEQGELASASAYQRAAVDVQRALGSRPGIARSLARLGRICRRSGDTHAARSYLEESLELQRELGDRAGVPRVLAELSLIAAASGEIGRASDLAGEALELTRELGDETAVAASVQAIAALAAQAGDLARAVRLFAFAEDKSPVAGVDLAGLRRVLGVVGYAEAWALGRSLGMDEAVREALDWVSASRESRRSEAQPPAREPREGS